MPPPNITGVLHMGHALVNTLQDILIRYKRMKNYETLWIPSIDHAGIATQTVVEKYLIKSKNTKRKEIPKQEFLSHIWAWKEEKEKIIINQLKKIGCSCDWSHLKFTMDKNNTLAVRTVFKKMYEDGLIYKGNYLVNWDPATQTALADDEVEYEEKDSFLWYLKYPLENSHQHITIATTRPETILGDVALAVSSKDSRYKHLIGKNAILPILNKKIPIIEDHLVDPDFGTGVVKITPAHDPIDYEIGQRHNLKMINIMTKDGKINENGYPFTSLTMEQARQEIIKKMKLLNLLEDIKPYKLRIGVSYRSKAIIQPFFI